MKKTVKVSVVGVGRRNPGATRRVVLHAGTQRQVEIPNSEDEFTWRDSIYYAARDLAEKVAGGEVTLQTPRHDGEWRSVYVFEVVENE